MDTLLRQSLVRSYYHAEAMAIYDDYYRPLFETFAPAKDRKSNLNRSADRPLTSVPLVFHCTTFADFKKIIASGEVAPTRKNYVSFTEIPIGELDRMKIRHGAAQQIAIAFPRNYLQHHGFAPVLYAKYHTELRSTLMSFLSSDETLRGLLDPFIELDDDVSAFQEIRTSKSVPVNAAVWLLSTERDEQKLPVIPDYARFTETYGRIARSYWHRTHQIGVLDEWQFVRFDYDSEQSLTNFSFEGEFYANQEPPEPTEYNVRLPDSERRLSFRSIAESRVKNYGGPMHFIDVARKIADVLSHAGENIDELLKFRQIAAYP